MGAMSAERFLRPCARPRGVPDWRPVIRGGPALRDGSAAWLSWILGSITPPTAPPLRRGRWGGGFAADQCSLSAETAPTVSATVQQYQRCSSMLHVTRFVLCGV